MIVGNTVGMENEELIRVQIVHIFDGQHLEEIIVVSFEVGDSFLVDGLEGSTKRNRSILSAEKRSGNSR